jgi:hypothetical protein
MRGNHHKTGIAKRIDFCEVDIKKTNMRGGIP